MFGIGKLSMGSRDEMAGPILIAFIFVLGLASPSHAAGYAPLDCARAASPVEKTICGNYELGRLEARTATLFETTTSLVAMGQRGAIQDDQRAFLSQRNACGTDVDCIRASYATRIKQLEAVMAGIASRGPF